MGCPPALAAMIGFSPLMVMDVISRGRGVLEQKARDTLLWFSVLISMSGQLNTMGAGPVSPTRCRSSLAAMDMGWMQVFALPHGVYFIMHYFFFASQSAHGRAVPGLLSMMLASGTPPMLAALTSDSTPTLRRLDALRVRPGCVLLLQRARADVAAVEAGRVHVGGEPAHLQHGGHGVVEDARAVVNILGGSTSV